MRKYYIYDWQSKSAAFDNALSRNGYVKARDVMEASLVLTDVDSHDRVNKLTRRVQDGLTKVFCYPHAAIPNLFWDGIIEPWEYTSGAFVVSDGHKKVMDLYGYPFKTYSVGWSYSEVMPFKPSRKVNRILFAPIHPNQSTFLPSEDKKTNSESFKRLISYSKKSGARIFVRHIDTIHNNGLWREPGITFLSGDKKVSKSISESIRTFDLVVSKQTFGFISAALGIPTIFMGETNTPKSGKSEKDIKRVSRWDLYKHLMMYPLDILAEDLSTLVPKACLQETDDVVEWKSLMIGNRFDERVFIETLNHLLGEEK